MQIKTVIGLLAGSVLVHAAVTACTSATNTFGVRDASAEPASGAAPEVSAETCNATYEEAGFPDPFADAGATRTVQFSEHAYPGKTKAEIAAHVTHWVTIDGESHRPPVYAGGLNLQTAVYARDGFAGAGCQPGKTAFFIWRP